MKSPIYGFVLNMWVMKKIDELKVESYVPRYITQEEATMITATPQWENYEPQSMPSQQI
ncbi:MAG: hypothetical protein ABS938_15545 [Psychrobacillus psychrodurans]